LFGVLLAEPVPDKMPALIVQAPPLGINVFLGPDDLGGGLLDRVRQSIQLVRCDAGAKCPALDDRKRVDVTTDCVAAESKRCFGYYARADHRVQNSVAGLGQR